MHKINRLFKKYKNPEPESIYYETKKILHAKFPKKVIDNWENQLKYLQIGFVRQSICLVKHSLKRSKFLESESRAGEMIKSYSSSTNTNNKVDNNNYLIVFFIYFHLQIKIRNKIIYRLKQLFKRTKLLIAESNYAQ